MTIDLPQTSFAAGVVGPELYGRWDIAKFDVGLREGVNVFVHVQGGLSNRAGTEFIAAVSDEAVSGRLVSFSFSTTQNYALEFGEQMMRVVRDGGLVLDGVSPYALATPWPAADLYGLQFVQSADTLFCAHELHATRKVTRADHDDWSVAAIQVDPDNAAPTGLSVTPKNAGSETYVYKVASVDDRGRESFPSAEVENDACADLSGAGQSNTIAWTAAAGAVEYRVYRKTDAGGVFGYIGYTTETEFVDDFIAPDVEDTPVEPAEVFGGAGDYPAAVCLHRERLGLAGSINEPEVMRFSRTADYENFTGSRVTKATDAMEETVTGQQVNRIRHMQPMQELVTLTAGGVWSVRGASGLFAPGELAKDPISEIGASTVRPLRIGDALLYVESDGKTVHEIVFYQDAGYEMQERTLFASHFFEASTIKDWCYARAPHNLIWVVMADGSVRSFTYHRRHEVFAWTEHDFGGAVESCRAVREGSEDRVYFIVRRVVGGRVRRFIERLASRTVTRLEDCWFLDCALRYEGPAVMSIAGLDHLEGAQVCALAEGDVVTGLTVVNGRVSLPRPYAWAVIGLPFSAAAETLPTAVQTRSGSARGRRQTVVAAKVQFHRSRGFEVGPSLDELTPVPRAGSSPLSVAPPLESGARRVTLTPKWNDEGVIAMRQAQPLPMTITAVIPEIALGDR